MIVFALFLLAAAPDDTAVAKKAFAAGRLEYDLGRFDAALKHFETAYALRPLPGFLFNMGQCHHALGNDDRAVFFYTRYLEEAPKAANRAVALELLDEARAAARRKAETALTAPVVAPLSVSAASPTAQREATAKTAATDSENPDGEGIPWLWAGIGTGVAVAAAAAVAVIAVVATAPPEAATSLGTYNAGGGQ